MILLRMIGIRLKDAIKIKARFLWNFIGESERIYSLAMTDNAFDFSKVI